MAKFLSHIPKEKLILVKQNGMTIEVEGLVGDSIIMVADETVLIEENDHFERNLPNGLKEYYKVIDKGFMVSPSPSIPNHYQVKVVKIDMEDLKKDKNIMILISHSTKDADYAEALVELFFSMGLNEDDIVCSSYPGVGVPLGEKVYDWLVEKFQNYDLHIIYLLSHNYYDSAASLNEMGAAWAMKSKWDGILLPGFDFSDIKGCIDSTQICIKLESDNVELKHRLGELRNLIVSEFGLRKIQDTRWEKIRDKFISDSLAITPFSGAVSDNKRDYSSVGLSIYALVLLAYASVDNGIITILPNLGATEYQAGSTEVQRNSSPRELALWDDAIRSLLEIGYIVDQSTKHPIYKLTSKGFDTAEAFISQENIDTTKSSKELLALFDQ